MDCQEAETPLFVIPRAAHPSRLHLNLICHLTRFSSTCQRICTRDTDDQVAGFILKFLGEADGFNLKKSYIQLGKILHDPPYLIQNSSDLGHFEIKIPFFDLFLLLLF